MSPQQSKEYPDLQTSLQYWKQTLADAPPAVELPIDHTLSSSPHHTQRVSLQTDFLIEANLIHRLQGLSHSINVSMEVVLLAAFQILLYRYSRQKDIWVAVLSEHSSEFGVLTTVSIVRTQISPDSSFKIILSGLSKTLDQSQLYQIPWGTVNQKLELEFLSSRSAFQIQFGFQEEIKARLSESEPSNYSEYSDDKNICQSRSIPEAELALFLQKSEIGIEGNWEYAVDLFKPETIHRMSGHFQQLLSDMISLPDQLIIQASILTPTEKQQFWQWNQTQVDYSSDQCLHQLFEAQVERTPTVTALMYADQVLSYQQLNQQGNQLAHYLQSMGIGPEMVVGICLERSVEMVVGLLGILKAGAAYVPIDPNYPKERIAYLLADTQIPILLTLSPLAPTLPIEDDQFFICLDRDWPIIAQYAQDNPSTTVHPDNLAYVIYTSGSTGQPKGVMITHKAISNRLLWMQDAYGLTATDRVLQKTPFSFDVSVWEFFWPLITGACLVVAKPGGHKDPSYLVQLICRTQITTLHFVPPMLQVFLQSPYVDQCTSLKRVICSGESLSAALQDHFYSCLSCDLHNLYGPTEATIDVSTWTCRKGDPDPIPIGYPIANTQLFILDEWQHPVPIGVRGELYLGGIGLARGYWQRPDLTTQKFIPNPLGAGRLYRTGDLARYRDDGAVEFIGRFDHQVKIRGFRVELGEVESALLAHPQVREAVIIARADQPDQKRLVAYLVADQPEPTPVDFQQFLKAKLPDYMVPSAIVLLPALPLKSNGKVDRQALPTPKRPEVSIGIAPRNPAEEMLVEIWQDILGISSIGIEDNFFELGGDSIRAMRVVNQLQARTHQIFHPTALWDAPTIAQFAIYLGKYYPEVIKDLVSIPLSLQTSSQMSTTAKWTELQTVQALLEQHLSRIETGSELENVAQLKPAVFILSPPRSGSTLLRVLLGGHPQIFAPPELHLLSFQTLAERRDCAQGRNSHIAEGAIRALMEIEQCSADQAKQLMGSLEEQNLTTVDFYRLLQEQQPRILVDKTPHYTYNLNVLKRAETIFEQPLYIYLQRHPYGMIHSVERARTDMLLPKTVQDAMAYLPRRRAELIWLISHQNSLSFLDEIPSQRQFMIKFETLVHHPKAVLTSLCQFLGLEFHDDMLDPYQEGSQRMTDGLHAVSRMVGDIQFHTHQRIDPKVADRWQQQYTVDFLSEETWSIATQFGYERIADRFAYEEGEL